ncbi:hypothetical protein R1sor_004094 [Riccia sorocarpa]|uniref:Uncharacterized protein n=1 Tax=Riccia sorocarpa TaxID=122646 RepID=A0ABD3H3I2_9MARC
MKRRTKHTNRRLLLAASYNTNDCDGGREHGTKRNDVISSPDDSSFRPILMEKIEAGAEVKVEAKAMARLEDEKGFIRKQELCGICQLCGSSNLTLHSVNGEMEPECRMPCVDLFQTFSTSNLAKEENGNEEDENVDIGPKKKKFKVELTHLFGENDEDEVD